MKRYLFVLTAAIASIAAGCGTVQSIVKSTFPYTTTLVIHSSEKTDTELSVKSSATSFDQIFTATGNNATQVKDVRIATARVSASNPANLQFGRFKSIKVYIAKSNGSNEIMVASRSDIGSGAGNNLQLDVDNAKFLDEYLRGSSMRVRIAYVLRDTLDKDASIKCSLGFSASPGTK
ncbi:MAG: hypothetical protein INR69_10445 [Mucilaginibacter polytrichastri]|nr:hypothetical protein [Mucilaginibacter polytrichastri]